ncbi:MAG TPA: hypothetical protein VKF63_01145 [Terracidiphilus sp.]|nr:hypothetical protein [Terracidiphilus sp.]
MNHRNRILPWAFRSIASSVLLLAVLAAAETRPAVPAKPAAAAPTNQDLQREADAMAATQEQLIKLLRLSPTLTSVVAHDPSLLSNQEYVSRNNPQLAQFLAAHPEVVRNPEFYLFTHLNGQGGRRDQALQRAVWPELTQSENNAINSYNPNSSLRIVMDFLGPLLGVSVFFGALIWLIRSFMENRRWSRIFKLQSEVHGKLIDKFSSSQELAAYMETEAGRRFLEAAPIPVGFEQEKRVPNALARVLTPLQIGIVLVLLGLGCYLLRAASTETNIPMLVLGTLTLMPGLGFIISAGVTWVLAGRLGLMPKDPKAPVDSKEQ